MRVGVFFLFLITTLLNAVSSIHITAYGYHKYVGIPLANSLMRAELATRIIGGTQVTDLTRFPYQAGIEVTLTSGLKSICGGSLVSNTRVLTAAHCWWDGENRGRKFTIVLGSLTIFKGGTRIDTTDIVVHPSWNPNDITFDIAVAKISRVTFTNSIQAVPLPAAGDANQQFNGVTAIASGFGKRSDAQNGFPDTTSLFHANLHVITNVECQKSFEMSIHGSHLCTNGRGPVGTCDGDSGGPLTTVWQNKRVLVGIVSFGLGNGCTAGYPSVFTRVTSFLPWIQANM